jgi:hypothetical protein
VRHGYWLLLVALLLGCAGGCTGPAQSHGPTWLDCTRAGTPVDPNLIMIETALLERPIGDPYLCDELWPDTDELFVGLELHAALRDNGLRVGQLIGAPPVGFQTLLLSPRCCANPERLQVPAGRTIPVFVGPVRAHSAFDVVLDSDKTELQADQVRFGFDVVATLTNDGRTQLAFTPKVETSESLLPFRASPETSLWEYRLERPSRKYPQLGWTAVLAPGQYLVVGCRPAMAGSLGPCAFIQEDARTPVQRLLVIRTNRALAVAHELGLDELMRPSASAPLVLQAAQPVYRRRDQ